MQKKKSNFELLVISIIVIGICFTLSVIIAISMVGLTFIDPSEIVLDKSRVKYRSCLEDAGYSVNGFTYNGIKYCMDEFANNGKKVINAENYYH